MTGPQHPLEHCGHECVCAVLAVGGIEGDRSPCDFTGCKHDTHSSSPAPVPDGAYLYQPISKETWDLISHFDPERTPEEIIVVALKCMLYNSNQHDEQIRQQERERVLGALNEQCERWLSNTQASRLALANYRMFQRKVESLRGEQPGEYANAQGCRR